MSEYSYSEGDIDDVLFGLCEDIIDKTFIFGTQRYYSECERVRRSLITKGAVGYRKGEIGFIEGVLED